MSVLISICTRQSIHARTVRWILQTRMSVDIVQTEWSIDANRNEQVRRFLRSPFSHLFFLDSDAVPVADTIPSLLAHKKEAIVAPNVIEINGEAHVMAYKQGDYLPNPVGLQQIDASGMSGLLISHEALEAVMEPWFAFEYEPGHVKKGEDFYFYEKLRTAGIELWCDFSLVSQHFRETDLKQMLTYQQQAKAPN